MTFLRREPYCNAAVATPVAAVVAREVPSDQASQRLKCRVSAELTSASRNRCHTNKTAGLPAVTRDL